MEIHFPPSKFSLLQFEVIDFCLSVGCKELSPHPHPQSESTIKLPCLIPSLLHSAKLKLRKTQRKTSRDAVLRRAVDDCQLFILLSKFYLYTQLSSLCVVCESNEKSKEIERKKFSIIRFRIVS
jgi:hypothetical protein